MPGEVHVCLNLASFLPKTLFPKDLEDLVTVATDSGVDSFCALPFRALMQMPGYRFNGRLGYLEDAWNPTHFDFFPLSLIEATLDKNKKAWDMLFPSRLSSAAIFSNLQRLSPNIAHIAHHFNQAGRTRHSLVEINPSLQYEPDALIQRVHHFGNRLVFDPTHLLQNWPHGLCMQYNGASSRRIPTWESQLKFFAPCVDMVDLKGGHNQEQIIRVSMDHGIKTFRIETLAPLHLLPPLLDTRKSTAIYLRDMVSGIKSA